MAFYTAFWQRLNFALRLMSMLRFIFLFLWRQKQYNRQFIPQHLAQFEAGPGAPIAAPVLKKIETYYCLGIPLTCAVYKLLYGGSLAEHERHNALLTAIATPLIDDFTDHKTLTDNAIAQLVLRPEDFVPAAQAERVVKHALTYLKTHTTDPVGAVSALHHALAAQMASAQQTQAGNSNAELLQLSMEKGAWSHVIFHYLIDDIPSPQVLQLLGQMGGLLQLSNDFFDLYKDHQDGIFTVANTCNDFNALTTDYQLRCTQFCTAARKLPVASTSKERFILFIALIMARGMVALRQYAALQKAYGGGILQIQNHGRKALIVDMERPINMWRTVKFCYGIVATS